MYCEKAIRFDETYKIYLKLLSGIKKNQVSLYFDGLLRIHKLYTKKGSVEEVNSLPQYQAEEKYYLQKEHIVSQLRSSDSPVKPKGDRAPPNQCVFVSNLQFDVTWELLKNLFTT